MRTRNQYQSTPIFLERTGARPLAFLIALALLLLSSLDSVAADPISTTAKTPPAKAAAGSESAAAAAKKSATSKFPVAAVKKSPPSNTAATPSKSASGKLGTTATARTANSSKPSTTAGPKTSKPNTSKTASLSKAPKRISRPPIAKAKIPATVAADGSPIWLDVNSARVAAASKKKLIVTDFYTDWCHWCKVMDKTTFRDPEVQKLLVAKFVCMRADAQDEGAGQELAARLSVTAFPTVVIFRSTGKPIAIAEGYRNKDQFLEFLKKVSAPNFDPSRP